MKPRAGMGITIWARMKPSVTPAQANAELAVLSAQAAADWPATHAHLIADVQPLAFSDIGNPEERTLLAFMNLVVALLVLVVSGNVALLMFARAATRESEIVVRTALGASRGRLVGQFVAEALVLSAIAAIAGLTLGQQAMAWGVNTFTRVANDGELLPFWITSTLPPISIAYGIGLALMATAVTGILPALKMTKGISSRLRETSAGGGGLKFGGVWTVLIVTQIAVTVTFPAIAFFAKREAWQGRRPADRRAGGTVSLGTTLARERHEPGAVRGRRAAGARGFSPPSPASRASALADKLPLMWNGHYVDRDGRGRRRRRPTRELVNGHRISTAAVEPDFFPTFEAAPIAGRLLGLGRLRRRAAASWWSTSRSSRKCSAGATPSAAASDTSGSTDGAPPRAVAGDRRRRARHGHGRGTGAEDRRCLSPAPPSRRGVRDDRRARVGRHDRGDERLALDRREGRSRR